LSVLAYELFLPLFFGLPVVIWLAAYVREGKVPTHHVIAQMTVAFAICCVLAVALVVFKLMALDIDSSGGNWFHLAARM
jgi:hypothetical protein